jgi:hypothetical protein
MSSNTVLAAVLLITGILSLIHFETQVVQHCQAT